ncbi:uncharacterized protein LAESUDRAFT_706344 [Laetiporus sulphureus 93-53]|uniref:Fanconi-associated nuclease n=1 Tax=Laetiporus sulphureus 93-53 TaxID=1314785 RepID=A0A165C749_9APHY|nr:uncharacterized protein LAESUDRAFT_706344 [Laetiporus sulphureus 93-53]KZT02315.1 hypothetical protein LAESUDRAFT_706344 [Laetiporus sulphureus 93-53]
MTTSPPRSTVRSLVFWHGEDELPDVPSRKALSDWDEYEDEVVAAQPNPERGQSMYVTLFEDMLKTVFAHEAHLFSQEELGCFMKYSVLPYGERYLLVRLCLRKPGKWHRLSDLEKRYKRELGVELPDVVQRLCKRFDTSSNQDPVNVEVKLEQDIESFSINRRGSSTASVTSSVKVKVEEREIIDLTLDDEKHRPAPHPSTSREHNFNSIDPINKSEYPSFADDEAHASLRELLECLIREELILVAKQLGLKASGNQDDLIETMLSSSSVQATLPFAISSFHAKAKQRADSLMQTKLPFLSQKRQIHRLREMVTRQLGKCLRINENVMNLFRRVNMVYFRSTEHTPSLMVPSILLRSKKRAYASYQHRRTTDIWLSREALLAYEEALELEAQVDALFQGGAPASSWRARSAATKTPKPDPQRFRTPITPSKKRLPSTPSTRHSVCSKIEDESIELGMNLLGKLDDKSPRVRNARAVKEIWEGVYPRWQDMLRVQDELPAREGGLERFECGHILTRIVCKASTALGILKEHELELEVLEALLAQRRWRRGRRGRWHERRALILMQYCGKSREAYERALEAVTEALLDDDTHIVYRPKLERRLTTLEKWLKVSEADRHTCEAKLNKAEEVSLSGVRVHHRTSNMVLDRFGRPVGKRRALQPSQATGGSLKQAALPQSWTQHVSFAEEKADADNANAQGKTIWKGRGNEEVSVETLALQYYEEQGYKGFHCEGRIVTTLFGLLFWDIIFANIPGTFETPYHSSPLDIAEDTFLFARQQLIERRLDELKEGQARQVLERVYDQHAEAQTLCVGVRWGLFDKQDLLEITECIGGDALAMICRLLCEDYAGRCGGVPDLCIWNAEHGECKFVEVKSPNDRAQENQKVWMDVLRRAGVPVELCHVYEQGTDDPLVKKKGKGKGKATTKNMSDLGQPKRKREESNSEEQLVESEDETEVDYSQLDIHPSQEGAGTQAESVLHETSRVQAGKKVVNRVEIVITSSPAGSPIKKRPRQERSPSL